MQYYGCPEVCDYDEDPPSCNPFKIYFLSSLTRLDNKEIFILYYIPKLKVGKILLIKKEQKKTDVKFLLNSELNP